MELAATTLRLSAPAPAALRRLSAGAPAVVACPDCGARQIVDTARHTAALYLMQFQHATERMR